jgi:hypothetical protein
MDANVIFEFVGGPVDGKTLCSDSADEVEAVTARRVAWVFGLGKDVAQREETTKEGFGTFRQPSPMIAAKAKAERWSKMQIEALMKYYEYSVVSYQVAGDLVMIKAHYKGVS